jgi:hypothetical protein
MVVIKKILLTGEGVVGAEHCASLNAKQTLSTAEGKKKQLKA